MATEDFPPNQPQSKSTESNKSEAVPETQQEWQTVNFPGTMSVDQIPVAEAGDRDRELSTSPTTSSTPSFLEIAPQAQPKKEQNLERENPTELIQALHECNQDLSDRIAELEAELNTYQKTLRDQEVVLNQQTQELALAQEQVTRLFGKQELSNQVIQRQQVLVETLTQQWETSQTKMAQMERDCALTQQRYNEQFHQLMQTQNTCRDLRSRLHRQQRHTLQFKAALERCLEMQSPLGQHHLQPIVNQPELMIDSLSFEEVESSPPEPTETDETRPLSAPKAPPVQPWSTQSMQEEESIELLEEIVQIQEKNPFYSQPSQVSSASLPELSPALEDSVTDWSVELPTTNTAEYEPEDVSFNLEELPQPQSVEDELERIQVEYGSLSQEDQEDSELDRLEYIPKSFPQDKLGSMLSNEQPQPQPQPQQTAGVAPPSSNWPAPLIRSQRRRKLQSLASIELPKLPSTPHWTPESESESESESEFFSVEGFTEIEPF